MRTRAAFALWCAFLAVTLWALHSVGSAELGVPPSPWTWGEWSGRVEPAVVIVSLIRLVALACGWYLALVSVVGAVGRRSGTPRFIAAVDAVSPAFLRVLLASAGGLTMSAAGLTLALTPLLAAGDEVPVAAAATQRGPTQRPLPPASDLGGTPNSSVSATLREIEFQLAPIVAAAAPALSPEELTPPAVANQEWVVETGDHFWAIAQETLTETWERQPTDTEISEYWATLIDANRAQLKVADNPDLIYPGQVMTLPPVPA